MFSRKQRLDRESFSAAQVRGRVFRGEHITFRVLIGVSENRFSVVVSRKVAKSAVQRHKIHRRTYAALEHAAREFVSPAHVIALVRLSAAKLSSEELLAEARTQFERAGILASR